MKYYELLVKNAQILVQESVGGGCGVGEVEVWPVFLDLNECQALVGASGFLLRNGMCDRAFRAVIKGKVLLIFMDSYNDVGKRDLGLTNYVNNILKNVYSKVKIVVTCRSEYIGSLTKNDLTRLFSVKDVNASMQFESKFMHQCEIKPMEFSDTKFFTDYIEKFAAMRKIEQERKAKILHARILAEAEKNGNLEEIVLPQKEPEIGVGEYLKIFEANGSGFFLRTQGMCYYGMCIAEGMWKDGGSFGKKILIFDRYFETIVVGRMGDDQTAL